MPADNVSKALGKLNSAETLYQVHRVVDRLSSEETRKVLFRLYQNQFIKEQERV